MALDYNCPICNREIGYEGICWKCRAEKERKEALSLTHEQIKERQEYIVEHIQELGKRVENSPVDKYFWDCLSYHGVISEQLQRAAVKAEIFYPVEIYYHAPEDVREALVERLMKTANSREASHLLGCLAMQGDEKALEVLYELKKHPKEWRKGLYVDSDIYAQGGGWTFDEKGKRQQINFSKCYTLEKKHAGDKAVRIGRLREDTCPHCGGKLVDILTLDGMDKRLEFLGINGKVTATCCPNCVLYTDPVYSRFQLDGSSEACFPYADLTEQEENFMQEQEYEALAENGLELGEAEVPLFYGAQDWEAVTIGGFAHWIQECNITSCPDCGKPMHYLAQLSWETVMDDAMDGTLYIEICPQCQVVSMHHQQT